MERARVAAFAAASAFVRLTALATVAVALLPAPAGAASSGGACVADVKKVIGTPRSAAMAGPLPAELVARLDRAGRTPCGNRWRRARSSA